MSLRRLQQMGVRVESLGIRPRRTAPVRARVDMAQVAAVAGRLNGKGQTAAGRYQQHAADRHHVGEAADVEPTAAKGKGHVNGTDQSYKGWPRTSRLPRIARKGRRICLLDGLVEPGSRFVRWDMLGPDVLEMSLSRGGLYAVLPVAWRLR